MTNLESRHEPRQLNIRQNKIIFIWNTWKPWKLLISRVTMLWTTSRVMTKDERKEKPLWVCGGQRAANESERSALVFCWEIWSMFSLFFISISNVSCDWLWGKLLFIKKRDVSTLFLFHLHIFNILLFQYLIK